MEEQCYILNVEEVASFLRKSVSWVYKNCRKLAAGNRGRSILPKRGGNI